MKTSKGSLERIVIGREDGPRGHEYLVEHSDDPDGDGSGGGELDKYHDSGYRGQENGQDGQVEGQLKGLGLFDGRGPDEPSSCGCSR